MKARSTLKKTEKTKTREEEFLEYLKSLAIEIDRSYFLPYISSIAKQNNSYHIFKNLKDEGRIIPLGRKSELDFKLIKKIKERLCMELEKKDNLFWKDFFRHSLRSRSRRRSKYFLNTSILYEIK